MKKIGCFVLVFILSIATSCCGQEDNLLIDDFEIVVSQGPQGTVDYGSGNGSSIEIITVSDIKYSGEKALKITFDAVPGGYMWIARGAGLDAKNADWQVKPEDIKWEGYKALSFYIYGNDSKAKIAVDIKDKGNELWRCLIEDNFKGWKQIICNFSDFFSRGDWQPQDAEKDAVLTFPLKSFQFEPLAQAKGIIYIDKVELKK
ncbi:MAG: carbohydrate binding domain-containing protein [Candidatus Omnitrophota bacterium]|nr:carbohydrate binding domain-containing protein [Candidatus Omnitrophota bacterium]